MVSQDNPNPGTDIQMREANVNIEHESFGKFSLGRGLSAALLYPEIDLSGTVPVALLNVGNLAPGMKFVDRSTNDLSSIQVLQHSSIPNDWVLSIDFAMTRQRSAVACSSPAPWRQMSAGRRGPLLHIW